MELLDVIELVNSIRNSYDETSLRRQAAWGLQDAYEVAKRIGGPEEEVFNRFMNCGGYPNCTIAAVDEKYLLSHSEYISIHKKVFELCAAGATAEEIARIF